MSFQRIAEILWDYLAEDRQRYHQRSVELFNLLHQVAPSSWTCEDVIGQSMVSSDEVWIKCSKECMSNIYISILIYYGFKWVFMCLRAVINALNVCSEVYSLYDRGFHESVQCILWTKSPNKYRKLAGLLTFPFIWSNF